MKTLLTVAVMLFVFTAKDPLLGRWESRPSPKGNITGVVFKEGNIMDAYINRKPFASGTYHFNPADSIFSFTDNGCNGVMGIYKMHLFSNGDTATFELIKDDCKERAHGMVSLVIGRVK